MYEKLFQKIKINQLTIANRFVMPAMNSNLGTTDHYATKRQAAYYAERAKGGFGLQITEFVCISEEGLASSTQLGLWDDRFVETISIIPEEVHKYNGRIFAQLHHAGRIAKEGLSDLPKIGASALPISSSAQKVHELTTTEVEEMIDKYVNAASRAKKAGFDGVEIHGAHGYLLNQFLSKATNKRSDKYGGSVSQRAQIVVEIIRKIKEVCGNDFPISVRFNCMDTIEGGNSLQDYAAQAILFENAGADLLNVSYGNAIESYYKDSGFNIENVKAIKDVVSIPVIGVGRMNDPALIEYAIRSHSMDLVALGRESVCDPHLPNKIKEGRLDEILTCTGCMQRCLYKDSFEEEGGISCMINPFSGKEAIWKIEETENKKKIAVVGAGPSGLQASWILAKRGHEVHLYEKENKAGGQYLLAAIPSMKQELAKTIYTYTNFCNKYGVVFHYNTETDKELLQKENYDEVIIATGSLPIVPGSIEGIHNENVYLANDILSSKQKLNDQNILVLGAGLVGAEAAELLGEYGNKVTIVDMIDKVAPLAPERPRQGLMERLNQKETQYLLQSKVISILKDGIVYERENRQDELHGYDSIVLAFGSRSNNTLVNELDPDHVHVIGDAKKAGDGKKAIYEATKLALTL